jgi:hypothetical protein
LTARRTLEELLVEVAGFAATRGAGWTPSPLQRAICRVVDGVPLGDLLRHPDVVYAIGDYAACDGIRPTRVDIVAAVRTFKSLLAACMAINASQNCDVSHLGAGEIPRVSVLAIEKDKAEPIVDHCLGNVRRIPDLAARIIGKPLKSSFSIMHPEEREVEISVVAGAGAGGSVVARWSAGVIFDEYTRMTGEDEGRVVDFDATVRSVEGRLLQGAQILAIGSPAAPYGPAYRAVRSRWRKPEPAHVVIKAPGWMLNPFWWNADRIAKMSPEARRSDVEAEFVDREHSLFSGDAIDRCMRP